MALKFFCFIAKIERLLLLIKMEIETMIIYKWRELKMQSQNKMSSGQGRDSKCNNPEKTEYNSTDQIS